MRFLNGFIIIGLVLVFISIAGLASGNRLLTEPGQPVNPYAWLEYLAAAILMLINGAVSIWSARQADEQKPASESKDAANTAPTDTAHTRPR